MPRIEPFDEDLDILQKLDDVPALPYQAMQREFDKSGNIIKNFLNNVIIPTINSIVAVTGETDKTLTVSDAPADAYTVGEKIKQLVTSISMKFDKAGGTINGNVIMSGKKIIGVATPTDNADAANKQYVDEYVNSKRKFLHNVVVAEDAFADDTTYEDYPFRATIPIAGITDVWIPEVVLPVQGEVEYAPVAKTYNGGVYIYADEKPTGGVIIHTILLWRGDSDDRQD